MFEEELNSEEDLVSTKRYKKLQDDCDHEEWVFGNIEEPCPDCGMNFVYCGVCTQYAGTPVYHDPPICLNK